MATWVSPLKTEAQGLPNPYRIAEGWAQLPNGKPMGAVGKAVTDPDGRHIWAVVRCERLEDPRRFGDECRDSKSDPIVKFGPDGKVVKTMGGGLFIWPHGLDVDRDGNVWVTDAVAIQSITLENEGWERDTAVTEPSEPSFVEPA